MSIVNVALVGATGSLGSHILDALLSEATFITTALQRASSSSTLPSHQNLKVASISDDPSLDELTAIFAGQDAVIICYRAQDAAAQIKFGEAAFAAGTVKRFIPADFGSCDSNGPRERKLVKLFDRKVQVRESIQALADQSASQGGHFTWTSLVNGHFFDWGLRENFLHFNLAQRTADIIDSGDLKSSQATLPQIAKATVRILQRPEPTKNKMLFIQSFCVSQNEILASLQKAMKEKDWHITRYESEDFIRQKKTLADEGDSQAIEDLVFVLGAIDGNWEGKEDFAMSMLGLEDEDLDDVVKKVVDEMGLS